MSVMKNAMEGAFNINEFASAKKQRNDDITFEDFDTPSCLHVIRNCAIFDEFWKNGSVEKSILINQVIYIRNKLMHSNLKINEVHSKLAIEIILHLCKSFMIEGYKNDTNIGLKNLEHSYSSIGLSTRSNSVPNSGPTNLTNSFRPNLQAAKYIRSPNESIKLIETVLKKYDHVDTSSNKPTKIRKYSIDAQADSLPFKSKSNVVYSSYSRNRKRKNRNQYVNSAKFISEK